tara:strand:+ start:2065 stop:2385 length:321 start_codon:yes stop_codon:yes gene_type:complete
MVLYPKYLFGIAGFTPLPNLMFIRYDCRNSEPLHIHEGVHQQQMRDDWTVVFWFRYLSSKKWRQHYEVEAYKAQVAAGENRDACALYLSGLYYLDLSFEQAVELLK